MIGVDEASKHAIIEDLIVGEQERCLAFARSNPEIVLPDNLDVDQQELVGTPVRMSFSKPVGTVIAIGETPAALN